MDGKEERKSKEEDSVPRKQTGWVFIESQNGLDWEGP